MWKNYRARGALLLGLVIVASGAGAQEDDPVIARARTIITSTRGFWTALGYTATRAQYTAGWIAAPAYGYALLAAPDLAFTGTTRGPAGAGIEVGNDVLLWLAETSIGSPRLAAQRVAAGQRDEALAEYSDTYAIAHPSLAGQPLSHAGASEFLEKRWSLYRLEAAGALYSATLSKGSAAERIATSLTRQAVERLVDQFHLRGAGSHRSLPIAQAVFFCRDLNDLLSRAGEGLGAYQPYETYVATLSRIDDAQRRERRELDSIVERPGSADRSAGLTASKWQLSSASYRESADISGAVHDELGDEFRPADWTQLAGLGPAGIQSLFDRLGVRPGEVLLVTWHGSTGAPAARRYFVQRGTPDASALVFARAGNVAWLGSWFGYDGLRILAVRASAPRE